MNSPRAMQPGAAPDGVEGQGLGARPGPLQPVRLGRGSTHIDPALLPDGDQAARVIREAHRWYEHLISLWAPGIIEAAFDLGVFTALAEGPKTAAEVANDICSDPDATRVLLNGLSAYDLLQRVTTDSDAPVYILPTETRECLLPGGLYSLAGKIRYDRALAWSAWRNLADSVRTGAREENGSERLNQICVSDYVNTLVEGINFWAPPVVDLLASALEERGWAGGELKVMLDVGCGTGLYSQLLLQRYPFLSAVGLDEKRIIPMAIAQSERLGVASRFKSIVCDFQEDEWGEDFDLIVISNVFHLQTRESAQVLASKAGKGLAEGGHLAIVDHIIDEDSEGQSMLNRYFRLFAVSLLATGGGGSYTVGDYDEWFVPAGLRRQALIDTPMHRILMATRL
jgi:SAM-dependent methyltransferase